MIFPRVTFGIDLPIHIHKKGIRILGISESFVKGTNEYSTLSGVVMRVDMIIDGFTFSKVTVGGMDATEKIIEMYYFLDRQDINVILLNSCIISWCNVIDLNQVDEYTKLPLICITYNEWRVSKHTSRRTFLKTGRRKQKFTIRMA